MVTVEINGEVTHAFLDHTYIKNFSEKIDNVFDTTLNKYGLPLEGVYHP